MLSMARPADGSMVGNLRRARTRPGRRDGRLQEFTTAETRNG
jgi:hypothetical protein